MQMHRMCLGPIIAQYITLIYMIFCIIFTDAVTNLRHINHQTCYYMGHPKVHRKGNGHLRSNMLPHLLFNMSNTMTSKWLSSSFHSYIILSFSVMELEILLWRGASHWKVISRKSFFPCIHNFDQKNSWSNPDQTLVNWSNWTTEKLSKWSRLS